MGNINLNQRELKREMQKEAERVFKEDVEKRAIEKNKEDVEKREKREIEKNKEYTEMIVKSELARLDAKFAVIKGYINQMSSLYTEINLPEVKDWPHSDIIKYNALKIELKNTEQELKKLKNTEQELKNYVIDNNNI